MHRDCSFAPEKQAQLLKVKAYTADGAYALAGDGVLVCTPTGSTAYSLSAGGAILTPEVPVFMLTPICAFSMRARPIVFSNDEEVALKIEKGKAAVTLDGLPVACLPETGTIFIKKAPFTADFLVKDNSDFFTKVKTKLNE
jgi:NAD+ kinase